MISRHPGLRRPLLAAVLGLAWMNAAADATPPYTLSRSVVLGPPDRWDYLHYDTASRRVYVAHGSEITVVDGRSGALLGRLQGIGGAHGVDLSPDQAFADNGERGSLTIFDPATLKPLREVPADADSDALVYDPASRRVFVMNGDAQDASAIDPAAGQRLANIALDGKPEAAVVDGAGKLYVNIKDKSEIVRVDTAALRVDARWPIPDCKAPHGLAIDTSARRLFSSCVNSRLVVVDAGDGHVAAELPIGKGTDSAAFDPVRKRIFSANGEGTLTVIGERGGDQFAVLGNVSTAGGARTMALDPDSGRIFVVTAAIARSRPPDDPNRPPRFDFVPGSAKLLMFDPAP